MRRSVRLVPTLLALAIGTTLWLSAAPKTAPQMIGINIVLNTEITDSLLGKLGLYGKVRDVLYPINALTLQAPASRLSAIQKLPFVAAANPDAERDTGPVTAAGLPEDLSDGVSTWNLDAINVTDFGSGRTIGYNGEGVYVAVLDTGLVKTWRAYFPAERIATEYARCFGGGGGDVGWVSTQPNKWERDQNSHGTHVTSTILGYNMFTRLVNGVAPMATVIPVKVLNQNGSGWSSVIARGITYVADLKAGPLADFPVVINMSLGGIYLDAAEKAAIDYAISQGVIIVASAGNLGTAGMGYPGAYPPVISVAAAGWTGEWLSPTWWRTDDVLDPTNPEDFYITDFSSRALPGQDLDVAAPGSWIVGPYQVNGQLSWYFLGGTSMASPHVAGIVALMAQKYPQLIAGSAESILENTAIAFSADVWPPGATGAGLATADAALEETP